MTDAQTDWLMMMYGCVFQWLIDFDDDDDIIIVQSDVL